MTFGTTLVVLEAEWFNKCVPFLNGQWGCIRIYKTCGRTAWKMARPIARSLHTEDNTMQGKFIRWSILQVLLEPMMLEIVLSPWANLRK